MLDLNKAMYRVLIVGMISSTILYVCGLLLLFLQNPNPLQTEITHYSNFRELVQQLLAVRAAAVLTFATIVLIATPITRVLLSVFVFAANRDRKFVLITGIVVLILLISVVLGYFWNLSID
jgi:uncharacterized membrane protein